MVDSYSLLVNATDHGQPQKSGSTLLRVRVLDENDNSPRFSELTYTATIPEDVARGHTVMRVLASDPDQGQNGEVAYYLGNDTDGFFTVNSTSGDIVTSGSVAEFSYRVFNLFYFVVNKYNLCLIPPQNMSKFVVVKVNCHQ